MRLGPSYEESERAQKTYEAQCRNITNLYDTLIASGKITDEELDMAIKLCNAPPQRYKPKNG